MLVVIADVERHSVQRTVVRVRLLTGYQGEVLLNPTRPERVQTDRKDGRGDEILERPAAGPHAKAAPCTPIWTTMFTTVQASSSRTRVRRLGRTMPWITMVPATHARLGHSRSPDDLRLGRARYARVELEIAHVAMVEEVVLGERDRSGHDQRQVREDGDETVCRARSKHEVVAAVVDQRPQRVVDGGSDDVGARQPEEPRPRADEQGQSGLGDDQAERPHRACRETARPARAVPDVRPASAGRVRRAVRCRSRGRSRARPRRIRYSPVTGGSRAIAAEPSMVTEEHDLEVRPVAATTADAW